MNENTKLAVNVKPTKETADKKVNNFVKDVVDAGHIELDPAEKISLQGYLPQGFNGEQLTLALNLYAKGAKSEDLEAQIDKSIEKTPGLTEEQIQSLYAPAYLVAAFEEYDPKRSITLQSSFEPEISYSQVPEATVTSPNRFVFQKSEGGFSPVIREFVGQGVDIAKNKVKGFAIKAIKKGGKKLAQSAIKRGTGIALKAGVKAAARLGISGALAPLTGGLSLVATELAYRALGAVKKAVSKITDVIFGKEDKNKKLAVIGGLLFAGGLFLGSIPLMILGAGIGAAAVVSLVGAAAIGTSVAAFFSGVVFVVTSSVAAVAGWLIAAIIIIPLLVAFIIFIINSGGFVVPEGPETFPSESLYIDVEKSAEPTGPFDNNELPQTITYTITVTAVRSTLTNINFEWRCQVLSDFGQTCPTYGNVTINGESAPTVLPPEPPEIISPTTPYVITYTMLFRAGQFEDTATVDTFTVTADVPESSGERASGSATVVSGNPPTACVEFQPSNAPYIGEFQAAAAELASHVTYASKLCAAGPIIAQLNTTGPEVTGACAGVSGTNTMFFNNCRYFRTHGQAFVTYLFAHESGHLYAKRVPGDYSQFLLDNVPGEGYLPTYCISGQPRDWEDFAETIGDYVDNGRLGSLCKNPDERPFVLCDSRFTRHCSFAEDVLF